MTQCRFYNLSFFFFLNVSAEKTQLRCIVFLSKFSCQINIEISETHCTKKQKGNHWVRRRPRRNLSLPTCTRFHKLTQSAFVSVYFKNFDKKFQIHRRKVECIERNVFTVNTRYLIRIVSAHLLT